MRCTYCGNDIPSLNPFSMCPTCGQPMEAPAASPVFRASINREG